MKKEIMKKFVKNFWSLNVDEALVANWLKQEDTLGSDYEIFFPINAQLEYVDLIVFNKNNQNTVTIQVKSSQSYLVKDKNDEYWASGHDKITLEKINPAKVDFFIFTCYYPELLTKKKITVISRDITNYFVVFQTSKLLDYVMKFKKSKPIKSKRIPFSFYIHPEDGKLYEDWRLKKQYEESDKPMLALRDTFDNYKIIKKMLQ
jgi:hypothetical protein